MKFQALSRNIRGDKSCLDKWFREFLLTSWAKCKDIQSNHTEGGPGKVSEFATRPLDLLFLLNWFLAQGQELESGTPMGTMTKCKAVDQRLSNSPYCLEGPSTYWDVDSLGLIVSVRDQSPISHVLSTEWLLAAKTIDNMFPKRGKSIPSTWDYITPISD